MDLPEWQRLDRAARAPDLDRLAGDDLVASQNRRVVATGRRSNRSASGAVAGGRVGILDAATPIERHLAQIVDAVRMIGVVVGIEHASTQPVPASSSCWRRSGEVSTRTAVLPPAPSRSTSSEQRRRRFFGFWDRITPMIADPRHTA